MLIETRAGSSKGVADKIRPLEHVIQVDPVTGPYDLIVVVEGPDLNEVTSAVRDGIRSVEGITRTTTCISLNGKTSMTSTSS